jgi:hypothetical protein
VFWEPRNPITSTSLVINFSHSSPAYTFVYAIVCFSCYILSLPSPTMPHYTPLSDTVSPASSPEASALVATSSPSSAIDVSIFEKTGESPKCFLFKEDYAAPFYIWFKSTGWYDRFSERKKVLWGSIKKASTWQFFQECARVDTGEPMISCTRCREVLQHPSGGRRVSTPGTSGMTSHVTSAQCQKGALARGNTQDLRLNPWKRSVSLKLLVA